MEDIKLIHGDCLEEMKNIPDKSVDCILCDLPYGTTRNKWDIIIPLENLWSQYKRVIKNNGAIVLFGCEPFSSYLRLSNIKMYKYDWVWNKKHPVGQLNAKKQPLRQHEMITVFYSGQCKYHPILHKNRLKRDFVGIVEKSKKESNNYGKQYNYYSDINSDSMSYPRSIIEQTAVIGNSHEKVPHPTQKPVALIEYLIKTYTNEGDLVLDNCMGSGSCGVAAVNTNRKFIGIELDEEYFNIAQKRIQEAQQKLF